MPAVGQDQWWKPLTDLPQITKRAGSTPSKCVRAPCEGRKITHHAIAHLLQDERKAIALAGDRRWRAIRAGGGILMEWAVGKTNTTSIGRIPGSSSMPGAKIWWDIHYSRRRRADQGSRRTGGLALSQRTQTPKYRTYLTMFNAARSGPGKPLDIRAEHRSETQGFPRAETSRDARKLPAAYASARQSHAARSDSSGRNHADLSYVNNFNFNWMNNYIYADDAAPVLPKGTVIHVVAWHDNTSAKATNPDPNQWVGWGDRTVDEMAHAWVNVTYISDDDYKEWAAKHRPKKSMLPFGLSGANQ